MIAMEVKHFFFSNNLDHLFDGLQISVDSQQGFTNDEAHLQQ